jgi:hypothetical protein
MFTLELILYHLSTLHLRISCVKLINTWHPHEVGGGTAESFFCHTVLAGYLVVLVINLKVSEGLHQHAHSKSTARVTQAAQRTRPSITTNSIETAVYYQHYHCTQTDIVKSVRIHHNRYFYSFHLYIRL